MYAIKSSTEYKEKSNLVLLHPRAIPVADAARGAIPYWHAIQICGNSAADTHWPYEKNKKLKKYCFKHLIFRQYTTYIATVA